MATLPAFAAIFVPLQGPRGLSKSKLLSSKLLSRKLQRCQRNIGGILIGAVSDCGKLIHLRSISSRKAFKHPSVKSGLAGAFGYCLGGQSCLEHVRAGHPVQALTRIEVKPRQAVCSLHGLLHSRPIKKEDPLNSRQRMSKEDYEKELALPNTYQKQCRSLAIRLRSLDMKS